MREPAGPAQEKIWVGSRQCSAEHLPGAQAIGGGRSLLPVPGFVPTKHTGESAGRYAALAYQLLPMAPLWAKTAGSLVRYGGRRSAGRPGTLQGRPKRLLGVPRVVDVGPYTTSKVEGCFVRPDTLVQTLLGSRCVTYYE